MKPIVKIRYTNHVGFFDLSAVVKQLGKPKKISELDAVSGISFTDSFVQVFEFTKDNCAYLVVPRMRCVAGGPFIGEKNQGGVVMPKNYNKPVKAKKNNRVFAASY